MSPERFGELLRRPHLLTRQNATELEALIAEYPWAGPLRQLRFHKALVDGDEAGIALWGARAEPFVPRGARAATASEMRTGRAYGAANWLSGGNALAEAARSDFPTAISNTPSAVSVVMASVVGTTDWYLQRHGLVMDSIRPAPMPKEGFDSYRTWQQRRARSSWRELIAIEGSDAAASGSARRGAHTAPEPEVASETLAEILAEQGHRERAIRMYRELTLRYPAKSDTFTARIEALQLLS